MESKHSIFESFSYAFQGIGTEFKKGRNFRIQLLLGVIASVLAYFLKFTTDEWAILIMTISAVLILELINTAVEEIVNIVSPEVRPQAKIAKDVAAASVLVASIASVLIAAFLFLPKII